MSQMGPQVDIPVGAPETPGSNIGAWQGLTIKEILEKVDLSNIIMEEDNKQKIAKNNPMISSINPESAFLGPKLWSRPMPMSGGGVKMNEDFSGNSLLYFSFKWLIFFMNCDYRSSRNFDELM